MNKIMNKIINKINAVSTNIFLQGISKTKRHLNNESGEGALNWLAGLLVSLLLIVAIYVAFKLMTTDLLGKIQSQLDSIF